MAGRRAVVVAGLMSGLLVGTPMAASAQTVTTEPAPPASAEAVAAQVDGVVTVAHTKATADPTSGEATANALELGNSPPVTQAGGTQRGPGSQAGAVLDTGDLPVGRLQVLPWQAEVTRGTAFRRATARAALLRLTLLSPAVVAVNVLQSYSEANHTDALSSGKSSSDGATVSIADLINLVLLHSEASNEAGSKSYVIGLNGTELITNRDVGAACNIALPGILQLVCVSASGGPGAGIVSASTADAVVNAVPGLTAKVTGVTSSGAAAPAAVLPQELPATSQPAGLPRTGLAVDIATAVGIALAALGAALLWFRRRLSPAGAATLA